MKDQKIDRELREYDRTNYVRFETRRISSGGMQTQSVMSCCLCGVIISGMGGGGTVCCVPCFRVLGSNPKIKEICRQARINSLRENSFDVEKM